MDHSAPSIRGHDTRACEMWPIQCIPQIVVNISVRDQSINHSVYIRPFSWFSVANSYLLSHTNLSSNDLRQTIRERQESTWRKEAQRKINTRSSYLPTMNDRTYLYWYRCYTMSSQESEFLATILYHTHYDIAIFQRIAIPLRNIYTYPCIPTPATITEQSESTN